MLSIHGCDRFFRCRLFLPGKDQTAVEVDVFPLPTDTDARLLADRCSQQHHCPSRVTRCSTEEDPPGKIQTPNYALRKDPDTQLFSQP